ncbi:DUF1365 domain-containing protein [Tepidimonas sp.]|uniref:DUF1365 domain-containing protein n=1 Tax=Tepidimonas sp. TaxID=2002775 RepID=UPI002FE08CBC
MASPTPATMPDGCSDAVVLIGEGRVRHERLRPRLHAFEHRTWFLWLPMHRLPEAAAAAGLPLNRRGLVAFYDADHGDGRDAAVGGALAWLRELLVQQGIDDADGPVWLHTYPRVLGYAFKPVSFWYAFRADGTLRAIVAEVNNTFGQRHCYVLDEPRWGHTITAHKAFHVSPFCAVQGHYRFRFLRAQGAQPVVADDTPAGAARVHDGRTVVRIEHHDAHGPLLLTSVSGALRPAQAGDWSRLLWRYRWHSAAVIGLIHWHALRLWLKGVPVHTVPAPPAQPVTVSRPPRCSFGARP